MTDQYSALQPTVDKPLVTKLFPTPLVTAYHPGASLLNQVLLSRILDHERQNPGVGHSNDGGWQSSDDLLSWAGSEGRDLIDFAKDFANRISSIFHPTLGLIECNLDWSCNAWANINRAGHANTPHTHPGAYWSGVYYVDDGTDDGAVDGGGELEFMDPRGAMPLMLAPNVKMKIAECLGAGLSHLMVPQSGALVMFPSWLMHSVRRYAGTRVRVSIAINFSLPQER